MHLQSSLLATLCLFSLTMVRGNPLSEIENSTNMVSGLGQKVLDKFDQVFYGLLDEAATHVTNDKQGAFKDMLIRHRGDLVKNVKENLINKDKITLADVKGAVERELENRVELFNYMGSGLWGKLSSWSSKLYGDYKSHCAQDPKSVWCLSRFSGNGKKLPSTKSTDGLEREYSAQ